MLDQIDMVDETTEVQPILHLVTSGHSAYANKKHRKGRQDIVRGKMFTKLIREITVAARAGLPDPSYNARLRTAIYAARKENLPKERIESAIKMAAGNLPGQNYEEVEYEAYGPAGTAFIVHAQTNNRCKTASSMRGIFGKRGGNVGQTGSTSYLFDHAGLIKYKSEGKNFEEFFEHGLELGATNVEECKKDGEFVVTCDPKDFGKVRDGFYEKYGQPEVARLSWQPKNTIQLTDKDVIEKVSGILDALEDNDDVQYVEGNFTFAESEDAEEAPKS